MGALALRSAVVLSILFGLLFAVAAGALYALDAPVWVAVVIAVAIMGLQYLISPWLIQLFFKIRWLAPDEVPEHIRRFLERETRQRRVPMPRLGVIDDGNPNAFTFGHYPGDARIVITRGLMEMCGEDEVLAVVGHELGHIVHWDFVVMTIAATVVLVLYYIYALGRTAGAAAGGMRRRLRPWRSVPSLPTSSPSISCCSCRGYVSTTPTGSRLK